MRAVLQRVRSASVTVDGQTVGSIGRGLVVLLAIGRDDEPDDAIYVVEKTANMRIFPDERGHMNRSAAELGAELLVVSQFTLYADTRKGRRPSFTAAAPPEPAAARFDDAVARFRATGLRVETGRFGETMDVALVNEGPVTIWLDSADRHR
ncbi:MAG: D-tyrosyl-tRNA(Tyr) deacylase [Chloroflexi bacterium]|nr:D-tyrosyl-tRNA(Tyr) deacylase [Chloroflexota bacterium]